MAGVNKVILVGNLTKDSELKTFSNGGSICNVTVATSESWTDKNSGEKKEIAEFHNVVFNGRLAEIADQYLSKGSKVYIEGKLATRKWSDKEGNDRYVTEIKADKLEMLSHRSTSPAGQQTQQQGGYSNPKPQNQDDDLPF